MVHESMRNADMKSCIQECLSCHSICLETIQECLKKGDDHVTPDHIRLLNNCAEICQTSANFMLTGSEFHTRTCAVCAEVCEACEKSCRDVGETDCADACKRCAESCRAMSGGRKFAAA